MKKCPKPNESLFVMLCMNELLPAFVTEHRFHPTRKWRFDYAWPYYKIALEVEGGTWIQGRHNRGSGFIKDMEKYNAAAVLGWRVVKCTPKDLCSTKTIETLKELLK